MPPPKIYNIKEPLDLDRLRLAKPTNKNGSHFIKTLDIDNPIYFLGPKCFTKQGFVKSGKKIFCDFVFSNEDSEFLAWLENLEESARKSIYANRETWFETPLDEHDIESSMSPAYKSYKSGKYFIVRANVPTALDKINIKVYDEKEEETDPENIKENTRVLAVFEFQGIRCSVRSFQFEIELKQLLIVEPEKLFETCIIGKNTTNTTTSSFSHETDAQRSDLPSGSGESFNSYALTNAQRVTSSLSLRLRNCPTSLRSEKEHEISPDTTSQEPEPAMTDAKRLEQPSNNSLSDEKAENEQVLDEISNDKDTEFATDKPNVEVPIPVEIFDADFPLEDITDSNTEKEPPLRLKKRNDVYYKLYKEMRQRAREAKREAFANYLEAKRIKNTYLLEDVSDSESDEDDS